MTTAGARPAAVTNKMLAPVADHPDDKRYWWHDPHYLEESKRSCCAGG